ncbi:unannotated protein [freshwater metagenome]|uniref:Unannotated protein n=1 Tax=freshwater metagenome TaxID=449393 RepID=A0A6J6CT24_9ZZZZ
MSEGIEAFGDALMLLASAYCQTSHEGTDDESQFRLIR